MQRSFNILVVEDDPEIGLLIKRHLVSNDFKVTLVQDGVEMDRQLKSGRFDLVLLDLMLPGEDGISICRRLRASSPVPIIIVSAKNEDVDRVIGLEIGADDYVAKPFNPRELIARVRALFRRVELGGVTRQTENGKLFFEGWRMDSRSRQLFNAEDALVSLTPAEFDLLQVLAERNGRVLSRDQLIDLTLGRIGASNGRNIDILISRLRSKLEAGGAPYKFIRTVRAGGYEFVAPVTRESAEPVSALAMEHR
ncbi:response regulator [Roseibium aggregatum]|uniref:Response regulator transcription factor n=1 Tax=Roseibium aggregatum TaxID=187304 RepID=A0A939EES8_9HYPH|nr:response regulator transcription factor [Roseibium aggregatum]MBN9671628.1 response regulator transcription factor [Roseibium aggregatum]